MTAGPPAGRILELMPSVRWLVGALALLLVGAPARGAELSLEFQNGLVTLVAHDVSVRQILDEWATIGQTRIINADQVSTAPVTLDIEALPERRALDVVLRSTAGYLAAPRPEGNPGPSVYDRIMVLAVSRAPAASSVGSGRTVRQPVRRPPPVVQTPAPLLLPSGDALSLGLGDGRDTPDANQPDGRAVRPPDTAGQPPAVPYRRVPGTAPVTPAPGGVRLPGIIVPPPEPLTPATPNGPSAP